ncbi:MAG: hypothetical protein S4CHLAM45_08250 [Chlamydiales bacterium]|nr:hypothetical protein [Chlamydiales bacterium]MCH9620424.1 hypothetical protein [Chlamydiales bacterium]MCH9622930.1 hypothetical protein [Chlamydiales bacterium]
MSYSNEMSYSPATKQEDAVPKGWETCAANPCSWSALSVATTAATVIAIMAAAGAGGATPAALGGSFIAAGGLSLIYAFRAYQQGNTKEFITSLVTAVILLTVGGLVLSQNGLPLKTAAWTYLGSSIAMFTLSISHHLSSTLGEAVGEAES